MQKFCFILLLIVVTTTVQAQTKKTITHESMWMLKRVGAPEISPDGKWVVFSLQDPSYNEKEVRNDLWIVAADGSSKARRLTFSKASEQGYKWSPDSKMIAFSTKREEDEVPQLYIMNIKEGGEAQRFTNISTGAAAPQWSPDGKMLLFTNKVFPGAFTDSSNKKIAGERKNTKYNARVYTSFPIRNWDQWNNDMQTHVFIQSLTPGSVAKDIFSSVSDVVKEGFKFNGSACWMPDNKGIIFSATKDFISAAYQEPTANLYKLFIAGGDAVQLTNDGSDYYSPAFSADGRYLLCQTAANNNNQIYNLAKIVRYNWPSFDNRTLLATTLDRPVNNFAISADNTMVLSVEDKGNDLLYALSIVKGEAKKLPGFATGSYTNVSVSDDGKTIVSSYDNASKPAEIVRINSAGESQFLTDFTDADIASLDLREPETVWFTSSRGKKIKSLLIRPSHFDSTKKYPLFVVMHGGPAGAWKNSWGYRWNYHLLAAPGYVVLLTDYTGSTGYGEKFSQEIILDPLKGPADEINEAATDAIARFSFIDGTRQAAGGGSYGGHLANWMQATTTHYKCLIAHAGMVNSESQYATSDVMFGREVMNGGAPWTGSKVWQQQNPVRFAAKFKTPVLITVGERDFRVPLNNSIENFGILQRLKIPSKLIVFPEENHWILKPENSRFWYNQVQEWLKRYL